MKTHVISWAVHVAAVVLSVIVPSATLSLADASIPTKDISGASDNPLVKRYEGSFIVSYDSHAFAALRIPLSPLKASATQGERDGMNNRVYRPERWRSSPNWWCWS